MNVSLERGRLDCTPATLLLATAHLSRLTGTLVFEKGRAVKEIYLSQGMITGASSNQLSESFGRLLVKWGLIPPAAYAASLAKMEVGGHRHGEILAEMGMLDPAGIPDALRSQHFTRLADAMAWLEGSYHFKASPPPATGEVFSLWPVLRAGILRRHASDDLEALAARYAQLVVRRIPGHLDSLVMSFADALPILEKLTSERTVAEVITGAAHPTQVFAQLLIFADLGLVRFEAAQPKPEGQEFSPAAARALQQGKDFLAESRRGLAREKIDEALRLAPDNAEVKAYRAWLDFQASPKTVALRQAAAESLQSAVAAGSRDADLMTYAGMLLKLEGELGEAEALLRRALTIQPDHLLAQEQLRGVLRRRGSGADWEQVHPHEICLNAPINLQRRIGGESRVVSFKQSEIRIGSAEIDQLIVSKAAVPQICKAHCTVIVKNNAYFVRRNGTSGPVWINDRLIDVRKETQVGSDDCIRLVGATKGPMFDFRVLDVGFIRQLQCAQDGIAWLG